MKKCEQTKGQSVFEHGISVRNYLFDLINHLRNDDPLIYDWILPDWVYSNKELLLSSIVDDDTLKLYTEFHDCGKPFCLTIDSEGRRHFPNHSEVSYNIFKDLFNNQVAADLIRHDMDIHLLKSKDINDFIKNPYAITLLLSGLSEIHSNAKMFGGLDSVSFKIKYKSIAKNGKKIIETIKKQNN